MGNKEAAGTSTQAGTEFNSSDCGIIPTQLPTKKLELLSGAKSWSDVNFLAHAFVLFGSQYVAGLLLQSFQQV